jgi:hypothetical protein
MPIQWQSGGTDAPTTPAATPPAAPSGGSRIQWTDKNTAPLPTPAAPKQTEQDYNPYAVLAASGGNPNLSPRNVGQTAAGAIGGVPGLFGDIETMGREGINFLGRNLTRGEGALPADQPVPDLVRPTSSLPTSERATTKLFGEPKDEESKKYRELGGIISPFPFGTLAKGLGLAGRGVGATVSAIRGTESAAKIGGLAEKVRGGELAQDVLTPARNVAVGEESAQSIEHAGAQFAENEQVRAANEAARAASEEAARAKNAAATAKSEDKARLENEARAAERAAKQAEQTQREAKLAAEKQHFAAMQATKRTEARQAGAIGDDIAEREAAGQIDASARGGEIQGAIKRETDRKVDIRKKGADQDYGAFDEAAGRRIAAKDYFQTSKPGQDLRLWFKKAMSTARNVTQSAASREDLARIWADLYGVENKTGVAYSSPDVMREVLRRVRDRSRGHPATGYDAIDQQQAGDLAERISKALAEWEPTLQQADKNYKLRSDALQSTQTVRGTRALKREKFDYNQLATDPKALPDLFFKSRQGVEDLIDLTGSLERVETFAWDHVLDSLRGKTPQQAAQWVEAQRSWLNQATLPDTFAKATALVDKAEYAAGKAATATGQAAGAVKRGRELRRALRTGASEIEDLAKPVTPEPIVPVEPKPITPKTAKEIPLPGPGPKGKALAGAQADVSDLASRLESGTIKPDDLIKEVRQLLGRQDQVMEKATKQRLNAELDEIQKIKSHEAKVKKIAALLAGLTAAGLIAPKVGQFVGQVLP